MADILPVTTKSDKPSLWQSSSRARRSSGPDCRAPVGAEKEAKAMNSDHLQLKNLSQFSAIGTVEVIDTSGQWATAALEHTFNARVLHRLDSELLFPALKTTATGFPRRHRQLQRVPVRLLLLARASRSQQRVYRA